MNKYEDMRIKLEVKREELEERLGRIRISKRKEHDKDFSEQASEREREALLSCTVAS